MTTKKSSTGYGGARTHGVSGELSGGRKQQKVREQNARASANPVANWRTKAGEVKPKSPPPLAKT